MKWKENLKYILFGVISAVILAWLTFSQIRCNRLQKELNAEKIKNLEQVDSLVYINQAHQKQIEEYKSEIISLESVIDSLYKVKRQIIVKKDNVVVSNSTSEAVSTLKNNLNKWKK